MNGVHNMEHIINLLFSVVLYFMGIVNSSSSFRQDLMCC